MRGTSKTEKEIPGLNVQWPWSQLLITGKKTVETRSYSLPSKYLGRELAIIETPGKSAEFDKARIIGTVIFSHCVQYKNFTDWKSDYKKHLVKVNDVQFKFQNHRPKYGWHVQKVTKFKSYIPAPYPRGIIFATKCKIFADL